MSTHTSVLVVEDDEHVRSMLEIALATEGFVVTTAPDGHSALERLQENPPQVVVLDVDLPDVDGRDIARMLRTEPQYAGIGIVYSSGLWELDDQWEMWSTGADSVLTKPFELDDLIAEIHRVTEHRGSGGTYSSGPPPRPVERSPGTSAQASSASP